MAERSSRSHPHDTETYVLIGAAMRVHTELGAGFLESVYREALIVELTARGVPFVREPFVTVWYAGQPLATAYRPDFLCFDRVIVEVKAASGLTPTDHAQVINYLKATRQTLALLLNFGTPRLEYRRFVLGPAARPAAD